MGELIYDFGIACYILSFVCGVPVATSTFGVRRLMDDGPALETVDGKEVKAPCPDEYRKCPRHDFMQLMATRGLLKFFALTSAALGIVFIRIAARL